MKNNEEIKLAVLKIITECDQTGDADDTCYSGAEEIFELVTAEMAARLEELPSNHFAGISPDSISRETAIKALQGGG